MSFLLSNIAREGKLSLLFVRVISSSSSKTSLENIILKSWVGDNRFGAA